MTMPLDICISPCACRYASVFEPLLVEETLAAIVAGLDDGGRRGVAPADSAACGGGGGATAVRFVRVAGAAGLDEVLLEPVYGALLGGMNSLDVVVLARAAALPSLRRMGTSHVLAVRGIRICICHHTRMHIAMCRCWRARARPSPRSPRRGRWRRRAAASAPARASGASPCRPRMCMSRVSAHSTHARPV